jgi:hypothetical protein
MSIKNTLNSNKGGFKPREWITKAADPKFRIGGLYLPAIQQKNL